MYFVHAQNISNLIFFFPFFPDTLPSRPSYLNAENIKDTSFDVRWTMDSNSVNAINSYNINVTLLGELDHPDEKKEYINGSYRDDFETKRYKVDGNLRVFTIDKLLPFSLYNVTMESVNTVGKSLPTYTLRVLTLSKTEAKKKATNPDPLPLPPKVPELPDTKACCRKNNVTHARYVYVSITVWK